MFAFYFLFFELKFAFIKYGHTNIRSIFEFKLEKLQGRALEKFLHWMGMAFGFVQQEEFRHEMVDLSFIRIFYEIFVFEINCKFEISKAQFNVIIRCSSQFFSNVPEDSEWKRNLSRFRRQIANIPVAMSKNT